MIDVQKIAPFFSGWEETLILTCLQGCMGYAIADDNENPTAAQIIAGDFCFFAGTPDVCLAAQAPHRSFSPKTKNGPQ